MYHRPTFEAKMRITGYCIQRTLRPVRNAIEFEAGSLAPCKVGVQLLASETSSLQDRYTLAIFSVQVLRMICVYLRL